MEIWYSSSCLVMLFEVRNDNFYVVNLEDKNSRTKKIETFWQGLTNQDVIDTIKEVLNEDYDVDYEIELYKSSKLFQDLICNDMED